MLNTKYDLGIKSLSKEWKSIFSKTYLKDDMLAGLTVACIAIPLSLAIALASNVPPVAGLIAAIIGGIVCALFGGTPLAVSGPAAAMSVLIAANVDKFGLSGLLIIGCICGLLQILSGVFGFGTIMKFIPVPVVGGFTAGIGAIILIGQLPRAFDLPPPEQAHVISVITHIGSLFTEINLLAVALTATSFVIIHFLPKFNKKLPSPLIAIIVPTLILFIFPSDTISLIGNIPRSIPLPSLPSFAAFSSESIRPLIFAGISVYFLASLETLLSSSAVDKLVKTGKHDSNQELIGQGFGNMASAFFGGIPVTGVIARTVLNINAGGKTRRASIMHAFVLVACIFLFAPIIKHIPVPALAGILISVACRMLDIKAFFSLFQISKSDAYIFIITFVTIIFTDLLVGVEAGLVAAALIALIKIGKPNIFMDSANSSPTQPVRCSIEGALTFISTAKIEKISQELEKLSAGFTVIIDVTQVTEMDITGASLLCDMMNTLKSKKIEIIVKGISKDHEKLLLANSENNQLPFRTAHTEPDVLHYNSYEFNLKHIAARLMHGTELFKIGIRYRNKNLFQKLANSQNPHTLFIACADSRISPNLITSTEPGELFVIRNVGNVIPAYAEGTASSESAAIEFALKHLNIKTIIICGHANCGAIHATYKKQSAVESDKPQNIASNSNNNALDKWLKHIYISSKHTDCQHFDGPEASKENVLQQMKNFLSYPIVKEKLDRKEIACFAWYYDIGNYTIQVYSPQSKAFICISDFQKQINKENFDFINAEPNAL